MDLMKQSLLLREVFNFMFLYMVILIMTLTTIEQEEIKTQEFLEIIEEELQKQVLCLFTMILEVMLEKQVLLK